MCGGGPPPPPPRPAAPPPPPPPAPTPEPAKPARGRRRTQDSATFSRSARLASADRSPKPGTLLAQVGANIGNTLLGS